LIKAMKAPVKASGRQFRRADERLIRSAAAGAG
jgi:hypothetical protein